MLQVTDEPETPAQLVDLELSGREVHGAGEARLAVEASDCRRASGVAPPPWEQVALYGSKMHVRYRSRVAEIARLLAWNYQRFNMAPSTGLLRYVRRRQERPAYDVPIADLLSATEADILSGQIRAEGPSGGTQAFALDPGIDRPRLAAALRAVLEELAAQFTAEGRDPNLAGFQARSFVPWLACTARPTARGAMRTSSLRASGPIRPSPFSSAHSCMSPTRPCSANAISRCCCSTPGWCLPQTSFRI